MDAGAIANHAGPGGRGGFQFAEKGVAQIEVGLFAFELKQAVIGFAIGARVFVFDGDDEFGNYF